MVNHRGNDPRRMGPETVPETVPDALMQDTRLDRPQLGQMLICSLVVGKPSGAQLQALYELSLTNNRNLGLTGVLLCGNGVFVHWLEGLTDYLAQAWQTISKDNRHEKIVVLWEHHNASERVFGDWTMGLRSTIVAQDLLALLKVIKQQQPPKAMLRSGYYEVFSEAFALLERVCLPLPVLGQPPAAPKEHKPMGPTRDVIAHMKGMQFTPYMVQAEAGGKKPANFNEISSLNTEHSSMFKNPVPAAHDALFDMAAEGMDDLLTMLDMPLRWALGQELWSRRKSLSERPLHWTYEDKLVAVFDHVTWRIGMHPELTSVAYEQAVLTEKLRSANDIPQQFRHTTAYALFWDYTESELSGDVKLPPRFLQHRIRLRRQPPVPAPTLSTNQQRLLVLLGKGPERLADLAQGLGLSQEQMVRLLRPFYASRCIEVVAQEERTPRR